MSHYQPSKQILQRYARVLVNYALNSGKGIKPGEVVECVMPDAAKALGLALQNTVLKSGGHPLIRLVPTLFDKDFFRLADERQLTFFPEKYLQAKADLIDHQIGIIADVNPLELQSVRPQKIILKRDSQKPYRDWLDEKETAGKFTWTLGLLATPAKAKLAGLSLRAYWQQIIKACFLDKADPISQWQKVSQLQQEIIKKLNFLPIQLIKVKGQDTDLTIKIGENRQWVGGSGRNIPSFEIFTSPDWRGVSGWMRFNEPIFRYGNKISGVYLELKHGLVVKAQAKTGQKLLTAMVKSKNADKIGEFSLTDKRLSRINHIMAEILFDENISGQYGNCHLAIGKSYKDCYRGDAKQLIAKDWEDLGFNDSAEHTDFISTSDRTVIAVLPNHQEKIIYQHGRFTL